MAEPQITFVCAKCEKLFTKPRHTLGEDAKVMCPHCDYVFVDSAVLAALKAFGILRARFRKKE